MDGIEDYKLHCQYVREELAERARKASGDGAPPKINYAKFGEEQRFELAPEQDVVAVIKMAIGNKDFVDLNDWRSLFNNLRDLVFEDYRTQINKGTNDQIPFVKRIIEEKEAL